ncbi:DUF134 domain-containing protein [Desulfovibrio falkowii]|uniref:DUF134 domain-containing protein n=1 Tax=Desulfovibrio sp. WGS1351 TaxID=3366814 RepID=UPI00372D32F1
MPRNTCFGPLPGHSPSQGGCGGPAANAQGSDTAFTCGPEPGRGQGRGGRHRGHDMHGPRGTAEDAVIMTVDQYEALRLIDLEGMTQEACAENMHIARTTVQSIYAEARKRLADALVNGKMLHIEGGEYRLCNGDGAQCGGGGCRRGRNR